MASQEFSLSCHQEETGSVCKDVKLEPGCKLRFPDFQDSLLSILPRCCARCRISDGPFSVLPTSCWWEQAIQLSLHGWIKARQ